MLEATDPCQGFDLDEAFVAAAARDAVVPLRAGRGSTSAPSYRWPPRASSSASAWSSARPGDRRTSESRTPSSSPAPPTSRSWSSAREDVESEGFDRTSLDLPGRQDELVRAVAAANPRTVVVVNAGAPVELPWRDEVAAVLLSWFRRQEFGNALADVLLGAVEPGGRLPTTWPAAMPTPRCSTTTPTDGRLDYPEGSHIGHRAYLANGTEPAYWFGHGLGYTTWEYESLEAPDAGDGSGFAVSVRLRNTGARAGKQVVQVYASRPGWCDVRSAGWPVSPSSRPTPARSSTCPSRSTRVRSATGTPAGPSSPVT